MHIHIYIYTCMYLFSKRDLTIRLCHSRRMQDPSLGTAQEICDHVRRKRGDQQSRTMVTPTIK